MKRHPELVLAWDKRLSTRRDAKELIDAGNKKIACARIGDKKVIRDADMLKKSGNELIRRSADYWRNAVKEVYGDIRLSWTWPKSNPDGICRLSNGEVYGIEA